jgi:hypothetical protein
MRCTRESIEKMGRKSDAATETWRKALAKRRPVTE